MFIVMYSTLNSHVYWNVQFTVHFQYTEFACLLVCTVHFTVQLLNSHVYWDVQYAVPVHMYSALNSHVYRDVQYTVIVQYT